MDRAEKDKIKQQRRAFPIEKEISKRREFSDREVGLTHPDLSSFIRLNDQGDIEIFAAPGVGIIISGRSKSISIFGDTLRMFVKEDGLRWNNYQFNYSASTFVEPTLVKISPKNFHSAVNGIYHFLNSLSDLEEEDQEKPVTMKPEYTFGQRTPEVPKQDYSPIDDYEGLSLDQIGLIEAYSTDYPPAHIRYIIKLLKEGLDFQAAHEKALREVNE